MPTPIVCGCGCSGGGRYTYTGPGEGGRCDISGVVGREESLENSLARGDGERSCRNCPTNSAIPSLISPGLDSTRGWLSERRAQYGQRCPGNVLRLSLGGSREGFIVDSGDKASPCLTLPGPEAKRSVRQEVQSCELYGPGRGAEPQYDQKINKNLGPPFMGNGL